MIIGKHRQCVNGLGLLAKAMKMVYVRSCLAIVKDRLSTLIGIPLMSKKK